MEYFDYGPENIEDGFDIESFLEDSERKQRERLEHQLENIDKQLENREKIFEDNRSELESKLEWYIERLEKRYRGHGDVDELKQKVENFYRLLREQRLENWRDKQNLQKDRRRLLREINQLEESGIEELLSSMEDLSNSR